MDEETIQIIFGLLGGLALFIFGMNMMSDCLQKAAGENMKRILSLLTKNPILGVVAGALTTAVLQSSSATTVMAIGFVSAGLMTLPQAISIILGANIGTTITAQIIAFKITDYIYVFLFLGFMVSFLVKSQKIKNIGMTVFAFGLLFLGIETMGGVMKPLASNAFFTNMIAKVAGHPVLGIATGTFMTFVVQSSSATIAVLQNFASQAGTDGVSSLIGLTGAIPILLGDNVGTTVTALLACIGQSRDAKRTAAAHCLFNLSGCLLFVWFIKPYAALIQWLSPKGAEVEVIARQIANAHTGFNVIMTLIWIPLLPVMVKIVMKIIPAGRKTEKAALHVPQYLDYRLIGQPVAALNLVVGEVMRCSDIVKNMLTEVKEYKETDSKLEKQVLQSVRENADAEHQLNDSINEYLAALFSEGMLTEEQAMRCTEIMYILCDIDRIGGLCKEVLENLTAEHPNKQKYSKEAWKDVRKAIDMIQDTYSEAMQTIISGEEAPTQNIQKQKKEILQLDAKMRKAHFERVGKKKCNAKMTRHYNHVLRNIDRMGNSCVNLMDAATRNVDFQIFLVNEMLGE